MALTDARRAHEKEFKALAERLRRLDRKVRRAGRVRSIRGKAVPPAVRRRVEAQIASEGWMERIVLRRFKTESRHGNAGTRWRALSRAYARRKARMGYGRKINTIGIFDSDDKRRATENIDRMIDFTRKLADQNFGAYMHVSE